MAAQHGCSAEPVATSAEPVATSAGPGATSATTKVKVCFAEARNNTKKDSIHDFQDLLDDESPRFVYEKKNQYVRDAADIIQMASCNSGFRLEHDQVICPVVVVQEGDEISFEMAEMNVTFGDVKNRPKMLTSKAIKMDILAKMQGISEDGVCKDECHGIVVGLKDIECLVLISLTDTTMRLEEIQNGAQRSERTGRYRSETRALHRCLSLLAGLAPYIHSFGDDIAYGFKTSVVNGFSQRVTKSQVHVSKLLWRGMFEGHRSLMAPSLLDRVFQTRSKKRKAEDEIQVEAQSVAAGKSPAMISQAFKSYAGKQAHKVVQAEEDVTTLDADDILETLTTTLDHRRQSIGDKTVDCLSYFVTKYRETVDEDVFIQDLGDMCVLKHPETALHRQMQECLEAPECSQLRREIDIRCDM